jgi:hypothetical protein
MKPPMVEGPKARENFERAMKAVFHVPKSEVVKAEKKYKQKRRRKNHPGK